MKFHVGQKLWAVYQSSKDNAAGEITVTKVGRKWVETDNWRMRFDSTTMQIEGRPGFSSPGCVYLSESHWHDELRRKNLMGELTRRMCHLPSDGVTIDDIRAAAKLLKIDLGET